MKSAKSQTPPPPMNLLGFVTELLQSGSVTLSDALTPFAPRDVEATVALLARYRDWDAMNMPLQAPGFDPSAASWAAQYLCRALQFLMVRHLEADLLPEHLPDFPHPHTPEAIYSADLCLRYLPTVHALARQMAPGDPLVERLERTAKDWPYSAVGLELDAVLVTDHPSLQLAYTDRVVAQRDRKRSRDPQLNLQIQVALGGHAAAIWPEFEPITPQ